MTFIKKNLVYCIVIFSICFPFASIAQIDYRPGYIINKNNDTISGLLDYSGNKANAKICKFKKDIDSESQTFSPDDIIAYRFNDSKFYISKKIETSEGQKSLFLEYLLNGVVSLYYYIDSKDFISHFLIEKNGKIVELTNNENVKHIEGQGDIVSHSNQYLGLLKYLFSDCKEIQNDIEKTQFSSKSLIEITKKYHNCICNGQKCIIYEKKEPIFKTKISVFIGFSYDKIQFNKDYIYSELEYKESISPNIGMSLQTGISRYNESFAATLGVDISKAYFSGYLNDNLNSVQTNISLHNYFVNVNAGINYTYPKGLLRPTFAFGGVVNLQIKDKIDIYKDYISTTTGEIFFTDHENNMNLPTYFLGVFAKIGCDFKLGKLTFFNSLKFTYSSGRISLSSTEKLISIGYSIGMYF